VCVCVCVCDVQKLYNGESNFYHRSNPGLIGRNPPAEEEEDLNSIISIIIIIGRDN